MLNGEQNSETVQNDELEEKYKTFICNTACAQVKATMNNNRGHNLWNTEADALPSAAIL